MVDPQIRFYLDEHVARAVALGPRRRGIDVLTVQEAGLAGENDEDEDNYWGEIPGFQGVWARHATLEGCRRELREALSSGVDRFRRRQSDVLLSEGGYDETWIDH